MVVIVALTMGAYLNHSGFLLEIVPEFQALEDAQFLYTCHGTCI